MESFKTVDLEIENMVKESINEAEELIELEEDTQIQSKYSLFS